MRVLWLHDVFDTDKAAASKMATALKGLGLGRSDSIKAAYVAHNGEAGLNLAFEIPEHERYSKYPLRLLRKRIKGIDLAGLTVSPEVFYEDTMSMRTGVDSVVSRAVKGKTDLIALQTHARKGFKRFLLGSFAETLIHRSPVSLLVMNPEATAKKSVKRILYATDLSKGSDRGVLKISKIAKSAGATLVLFHVPNPSYSIKFKGQDPEVEKYRKSVPKKMAYLAEVARGQGVETEVVIKGRWHSIPDLILREASSKSADVVAVQAKSGTVGTLFLGSVARSVVRAAKIPVIVMRS